MHSRSQSGNIVKMLQVPELHNNQEADKAPEMSLPALFDPYTITKLPAMSIEQLTQVEELLAREFSELSRAYVDARQPRLNTMISELDRQIEQLQEKDDAWSAVYKREVEAITRLTYAVENALIENEEPPNIDDYELEFRQRMDFAVLPKVEFLVTLNTSLPFSAQMQQLARPYEEQLEEIGNGQKYQDQLLDANLERNKQIIWERYRQKIGDAKMALVEKLERELHELEESRRGIRIERELVDLSEKYSRAVLSVEDFVLGPDDLVLTGPKNIDTARGFKNRHMKNHRIEITAAKERFLSSLHKFEAQQAAHSIPQIDGIVRLAGCIGLTELEMLDDLTAMKQEFGETGSRESQSIEPEEIDMESADDIDDGSDDDDDDDDYFRVLNAGRQHSQIVMADIA